MKILVGIDPGKGGGIVIQRENKIEAFKMPAESKGLLEIFSSIGTDAKVYIEQVNMRPQDLKTDGKADSAKIGRAMVMQKLFKQYQQMLTVLELLDYKDENSNLIKVMPTTWQKSLNVHVKGEEYQIRKKRLANIAKEFFAPIKVINKTADAFLILKYAAKKECQQLTHHIPEQKELF